MSNFIGMRNGVPLFSDEDDIPFRDKLSVLSLNMTCSGDIILDRSKELLSVYCTGGRDEDI